MLEITSLKVTGASNGQFSVDKDRSNFNFLNLTHQGTDPATGVRQNVDPDGQAELVPNSQVGISYTSGPGIITAANTSFIACHANSSRQMFLITNTSPIQSGKILYLNITGNPAYANKTFNGIPIQPFGSYFVDFKPSITQLNVASNLAGTTYYISEGIGLGSQDITVDSSGDVWFVDPQSDIFVSS